MRAFQIEHISSHAHSIRWQLPVSNRIHHVGTIGFDNVHDVVADIRHQFVFFIAVAVAEIGYCSEAPMVKDSCQAMHDYMCNRFAGRGKQINFHDAIGEFVKFHNHIKMRVANPHHREYLSDLRHWIGVFQMNWKDFKIHLLPTSHLKMAA